MDREAKFASVNRLKILNQWRKLMRLVKVEDLRKDIEIISQHHERQVDRKDAIIQVLDRDLEDSEEQYQTALRAHLLVFDRLIDLHNSKLAGIELEFEKDLRELMDEFGAERAEINASHARHKKELLDIMATMEAEFNEAEGDARQEFESNREEIKNKNSEEYNVLRFTLEGLIEELERDLISRHFQELKGRMNKFREREATRLQELTISSQASIKALGSKMERAERILKLAEQTRRLETEREKVLPFYESSVEEEEKAAADAADIRKSLQATATGKDGHAVEEWDYLNNFFKRYNKVLLDVMAIERERERLGNENGDLRSILKQYLDGISVNEDVINSPNPLLVVNHKTNIVLPSAWQRPVATTAIEGSHHVMIPQLLQGH